MNKNAMIIAALAVIVIGAAAVYLFQQRAGGTWVCENGAWTANGTPDAPRPDTPCLAAADLPSGQPSVTPPTMPPPTPPTQSAPDQTDPAVTIFSPAAGQPVFSPVTVTGQAPGNWYFEASFPIRLETADGQVIARGIAVAQGDWMTAGNVPFAADLTYSVSTTTEAVMVLSRDNPSGLPEQDASVRKPITLSPPVSGDPILVSLFFGSTKLDPNAAACGTTYAVVRELPNTTAPARVAVEALLAGPTSAERSDGYFTSINPNVSIRLLTISNGVARIDFDAEMGRAVGGSCRVAAIRSQIENTLKQFSTVKEVVISVAGNIDEALQP